MAAGRIQQDQARPARVARARPPQVAGQCREFATKPELAWRMTERAVAAGVPFGWLADDEVWTLGRLAAALNETPAAIAPGGHIERAAPTSASSAAPPNSSVVRCGSACHLGEEAG